VSLFARLKATIGFTRTETQVLLFLTGAFLLGLGLKYVRGIGEPTPLPAPDYGRSDSTFLARSAHPSESPHVSARPSGSNTKALPSAGSVSLNTASREELMRLPGIGPAYADRIVAYRKDQGPFATLEELQNVKGIGPKTFSRLKPFLRLH